MLRLNEYFLISLRAATLWRCFFNYITILRCSHQNLLHRKVNSACGKFMLFARFFIINSTTFPSLTRPLDDGNISGSQTQPTWVAADIHGKINNEIDDAEERFSNVSAFNWIYSSIRRTFCCLNVLVMVSTSRATRKSHANIKRSQKRVKTASETAR